MIKKYLVTGAAGFIASKVCSQLLDRGAEVVGVDNLNDYYDVQLKEWRLQELRKHPRAENFYFEKLDIENHDIVKVLFRSHCPFDAVLNLAARAGVRYRRYPHIYSKILRALQLLNLRERTRNLSLPNSSYAQKNHLRRSSRE